MPVVGHAFVGLAVGMWTHPETTATRLSSSNVVGRALWTPLIVGLSYLPDILAQLAVLLSGRDIRHVTHAIPVALVLAAALTAPFSRLRQGGAYSTFLLILVCLLLHDVLDILQTTDLSPWWPLSSATVPLQTPLIPANSVDEALLFALVYFVSFLVYHRRSRFGLERVSIAPRQTWQDRSLSSLNVLTCSVVLLAAGGTHHLRQLREDQLEHARQLNQGQHSYREAPTVLQQAERWPSIAKPGRIDYLRAWTYEQMHDRTRAEEYYLRSYHADPMYFGHSPIWCSCTLLRTVR